MPTIKDALDIIGKLTVAEQESLKTMLLSPAFVKSLFWMNGYVCSSCFITSDGFIVVQQFTAFET